MLTPTLRVLCALSLLPATAGCTTYFDTPASPTPATVEVPDLSTFSSDVRKGGFASRSFALKTAGEIQVTLTSVTPSIVIGVGVGIPQSNGSACSLSKSVEAAAGNSPQLTTTADPGSYCVKVFDTGQIQESASFSVTVTHP